MKLSGMFKPKLSAQEQVRVWQRTLKQEVRNCEKAIRDIQREELQVKKSIRESAKRGDTGAARHLAKELVRSRRAVQRLHEQKAQMNSVSLHLNEQLAMYKVVGHLSKSTDVMKLVNTLVKASEVRSTMMEMSKEMAKAGIVEEMMNESLDDALDTEDMEEEMEEEVDKVLTDIAVETSAALPNAARKQKSQTAVEVEDEEVDRRAEALIAEESSGVASGS